MDRAGRGGKNAAVLPPHRGVNSLEKEKAFPRVTALLVDGDAAFRRTVQRYADEQDMVEVCALVGSARRAWELLAAGLRPQVLVLDTTLRDPDAGWLLRHLAEEMPRERPWVLLNSLDGPAAEKALRALLPVETYYTLVKPYAMSELFDQIYRSGCKAEDLPRYRVFYCMGDMMRRLRLGAWMSGAPYLKQIVCDLVLEDLWNASTEQLYERIADSYFVTPPGIASAIRRLAETACSRHTALYAQLCERYGKPACTVLSNTELIWGVAEQVKERLRL